jgi:hypothetical protein
VRNLSQNFHFNKEKPGKANVDKYIESMEIEDFFDIPSGFSPPIKTRREIQGLLS